MGFLPYWNVLVTSATMSTMRGLVRRLTIGLLALSFAASGVAARQCDAAHHSTAPAAVAQHMSAGHEHHDHSADHDGHAHDAGGASVHQYAPDGPDPIADDHMCAKCCGLCTLVAGVASDARVYVIFAVSPASFTDKPEHRTAATVKVEPGIPKPII
jgi:hypothetical protein